MPIRSWLLALLLLLAGAPLTHAQGAEAVGNLALPAPIALRECTGPGWMRFRAGTTDVLESQLQWVAMMSGDPVRPYLITRGETVRVGETEFLVAWRVPMAPGEFQRIGNHAADSPLPRPSLDTRLSLTLVNLRATAVLADAAPFDALKDLDAKTAVSAVFEEARARARATSSLSNLKQVGLGMMMYVQDYDEVFPPMRSEPEVRKRLMPYIKNDATFRNPIDEKPYVYNPALSGVSLTRIHAPSDLAVVWEADPAPDGTRGVGFADGHAKRVSAAEWARILANLRAIAPPPPAKGTPRKAPGKR
ncbi:MAG: DUF1559 domain-containing protein [Armatimonadota bacterium]